MTLISYAAKKGFDIFLDLKLHDIPNTVKKSIEGLVLYLLRCLQFILQVEKK
jgi:orotidine-5'-phosphate decarboxylase